MPYPETCKIVFLISQCVKFLHLHNRQGKLHSGKGCCCIQGVSQLEDITAGGDFLGLCDQKSSYKHVSNFGRLWSYDRLKLRREGNNY